MKSAHDALQDLVDQLLALDSLAEETCDATPLIPLLGQLVATHAGRRLAADRLGRPVGNVMQSSVIAALADHADQHGESIAEDLINYIDCVPRPIADNVATNLGTVLQRMAAPLSGESLRTRVRIGALVLEMLESDQYATVDAGLLGLRRFSDLWAQQDGGMQATLRDKLVQALENAQRRGFVSSRRADSLRRGLVAERPGSNGD